MPFEEDFRWELPFDEFMNTPPAITYITSAAWGLEAIKIGEYSEYQAQTLGQREDDDHRSTVNCIL